MWHGIEHNKSLDFSSVCIHYTIMHYISVLCWSIYILTDLMNNDNYARTSCENRASSLFGRTSLLPFACTWVTRYILLTEKRVLGILHILLKEYVSYVCFKSKISDAFIAIHVHQALLKCHSIKCRISFNDWR